MINGMIFWAEIIEGTGGHVPRTFWLGDAKVNVPPLIANLAKFLGQNAYLREEIKGVLYYQNSISFQLQEGYARLTP